MAEAQGDSLAAEAVSFAVNQSGSQHQYDELVDLEKDELGNITMVKANGYVLNELTREMVELCEGRLMNQGEVSISVPFGSVMNSQIFLYHGAGYPNVCIAICAGECGYRQRIYQRGHQPDKTPYNGDNSSVFTLYVARTKRSGTV